MQRTDFMMDDDNFSHIFKQIKTEQLVTSADGDFVTMECSSWLDLSKETEAAFDDASPVWKTDFSLIKSVERNDIAKL